MKALGENYDKVANSEDVGARVSNGIVPNYLAQLNSLIIIRHLSHLLIETQKHRGASMAVLEGNEGFGDKVLEEQEVVARLIEVISSLDEQSSGLLTVESWAAVRRDWLELTEHWRDDTVIANFEFHSHFIERVIALIWDLVKQATYFATPGIRNSHSNETDPALCYSERNHHVLIKIAFHLMPGMLENVAKLRGLATHACVRGSCDLDTQSRFNHLQQMLNLNKETLRKESSALQHEALRAIPSLPSILLHEHKLVKLQSLINDEIVISDHISMESLDMFDFATEIIAIYSQIIRDAVIAFQRRIEFSLVN